MNCDKYQLLLMDSLIGDLSAEARRALESHLTTCDACAEEAKSMESIWQELGEADQLRSPTESDRMVRRFNLALADFEAGLEEDQRPVFSEWWTKLWAARPVWQVAFASSVLVAGVLLGYAISSRQSSQEEIAELRSEIESMSRVVSVLQQHDSAADRLRAVSSTRSSEPNDEVIGALLQSARLDPNVNVRLAAVDALAKYSDRAPIRATLIDSLAVERSPLVQLAVLEVVAGDTGLEGAEMQRLLESNALDPTVLEYFSVETETL